MKLYDSLTQNLKDLDTKREVSIYLCGPTVYDHIHIGNIYPVIVFDFLIKYLRETKVSYKYIHNITDIDDKIIKKAEELKIDELELSKNFANKYIDLLKQLNISTPTLLPKVSDHIQDIQRVIKQLIDKNFATVDNGNVLFNLEKVKNYGEISKQNLKELKSISDFYLWKKTQTGKTWDSPWGKGRPGWHTECYAFIQKYIGSQVDIHGGGVDLKFPHHENENAHNQAIFEKTLANIWVHIGHLQNKEGKISKSSNNKFLVKDVIKKYSPNTVRFLFLQQKYSLPYFLDEDKLQNLNIEWNSFIHAINKGKTQLVLEDIQLKNNQEISKEFLSYIANDLNMPQVLTWLQSIKKQLLNDCKNKNISQLQTNISLLIKHLEWLGFQIEDIHNNENIQVIKKWKQLLQDKKYEESDQIREILIKKGLL